MVSRFHVTFPWVCLSLLGLVLEARGGRLPGPHVTEGRRAEILAEVAGQTSSAEQLWTYLQKWHAEKSNGHARPALAGITKEANPNSGSRDEYQEITNAIEERRIAICEACREFVRKYPADPRVWDAGLLGLEEMRWSSDSENELLAFCERIVSAPNADPATRARAREHLLFQAIGKYRDTPDEAEKVLAAYEKDYPDDTVGTYLVWRRVEYYLEKKPEELVPMLSRLVASPNKATADQAERELSLHTEPLDLKFTATDGKTVDLAKLRGKVVMLYFWATWGEPGNDILPKVQALRRKYGAKDFQIIGFSLDDERASMRRAIKAGGMDWPNINDTKPSQGSATAVRFHIASPQTVWLLDRQGVAKPLPRSADLDAEVRKRVENPEP